MSAARASTTCRTSRSTCPRDRLIVFTGLSGSGKSSLAFDTIYAEGQRRYVESLSAYARQFLGQMDKPDVDFIEGLSPAISIDQKSASRNPRSTVGTVTEVYDYLRLLYARIGMPHCPKCGRPVARQTPQQIVDRILALDEGTRFMVLAPVVRGRKGEYERPARRPGQAGVRPGPGRRRDGRAGRRGELKLARYEQHTIEVVVDRLVRRDDIRRRLTESMETALGLAERHGRGGRGRGRRRREEAITFSQHLACTPAGSASRSPSPAELLVQLALRGVPGLRRAGHPVRGRPRAGGARTDRSRMAEGALAPWAGARSRSTSTGCSRPWPSSAGFSLDDAVGEAAQGADRKLVLYGTGDEQVHLSTATASDANASFHTHYEGMVPWLQRRHGEAESDSCASRSRGIMREVPCPSCGGARLKPESLAVTVGGRSIHELCTLSVGARGPRSAVASSSPNAST